MKKLYIVSAAVILFACSNAAKENDSAAEIKPAATTAEQKTERTPTQPAASSSGAKIFVAGKEISLGGSLLVQKDKDHLKPGADYLVMLTASGGPDKESLVLNFVFDLKTGSYPVVGLGFQRGNQPNAELYGSILGGKPKLTNYKVNITECIDLGSNNMGGHKWSISGEFGELNIAAPDVMLMDKTKNHPKEIKIEKGSFSNLTFDDNWEEMMKAATEKMKQ